MQRQRSGPVSVERRDLLFGTNCPANDGMTKIHEAVATLINGIIDGAKSMRRPH